MLYSKNEQCYCMIIIPSALKQSIYCTEQKIPWSVEREIIYLCIFQVFIPEKKIIIFQLLYLEITKLINTPYYILCPTSESEIGYLVKKGFRCYFIIN